MGLVGMSMLSLDLLVVVVFSHVMLLVLNGDSLTIVQKLPQTSYLRLSTLTYQNKHTVRKLLKGRYSTFRIIRQWFN